MMRNISILGSTGSIGTQALDVVDKLNLKVLALTANSRIDMLEQQIRKYKPKIAAVVDEKKALELKQNVADTNTKVLAGMDGLMEAACVREAQAVLNSVVGMVGLEPTLAALEEGKDLALANKETLVAGGKLVMETAKRKGVSILPVDSEHSAIFQCIQGANSQKEIKKLIITASGGSFFGKKKEELENVTVEQALNHPNWSMGAKITIDSATLMNKGLEIIEAYWLFGLPVEKIDVVVHRESVIHSMIEYVDNSVIAQLGIADMRIPIQYAITYPQRFESPAQELDLVKIGTMSFYEPDYETFKCLKTCIKAIKAGGLAPTIANGANEAANALFRKGKIKFLDIGNLVESAVENVTAGDYTTLKEVLDADKRAREYVCKVTGEF
ncbi:MAG: 1-deoxy-D-xylulose-5-phosphate reductoisomerase [Candidatus Limousia pullorum]